MECLRLDEEISQLNIPTGVPWVYEPNDKLQVLKNGSLPTLATITTKEELMNR
jgi:hypothetical protein